MIWSLVSSWKHTALKKTWKTVHVVFFWVFHTCSSICLQYLNIEKRFYSFPMALDGSVWILCMKQKKYLCVFLCLYRLSSNVYAINPRWYIKDKRGATIMLARHFLTKQQADFNRAWYGKAQNSRCGSIHDTYIWFIQDIYIWFIQIPQY